MLILNGTYLLEEQYGEKPNLQTRIAFQNKYGNDLYVNKLNKILDLSVLDQVLDLGCGNGWVWKSLSSMAMNPNLTLCDFSKELVKACKDNLKNIPNETNFVIGNCIAPPFNNNSFSIITLFDVLHHFELSELDILFRKLFELLDDKGKLVLTMSSSHHMKAIYDLIATYGGEPSSSFVKRRDNIHNFITGQRLFFLIKREEIINSFQPEKTDLIEYVKSMWGFHELKTCAQGKVLDYITNNTLTITASKVICKLEKM